MESGDGSGTPTVVATVCDSCGCSPTGKMKQPSARLAFCPPYKKGIQTSIDLEPIRFMPPLGAIRATTGVQRACASE